jgi:hypothetical protein
MKRFAIGLYVAATIALLVWAYWQTIFIAPSVITQKRP